MSLPSYINLSSKSADEQKAAILNVVRAGVTVDSVTIRHQTSLLTSVLDGLCFELIEAGELVGSSAGYSIAPKDNA